MIKLYNSFKLITCMLLLFVGGNVFGQVTLISEGFEGGTTDPAGWSNNSSYYSSTASNANTGSNFAGMNSTGDWIQTDIQTNPGTLEFYARASGTTSSYTVEVQSSPDASTWTTESTISANGSNSGDITSTYQLFQLTIEKAGDFYLRWTVTARSGGSFYLDDVTLVDFTPVADVTAPVFQNSTPSTSSITEVGFDIDVELDEAGTAYYVVLANGASAPSTAQIEAGTDGGDAAALVSGTIAVSAGSTNYSETITGLSIATDYDVYVFAKDGSDNATAVQTVIDVTTSADVAPTLVSAATETALSTNSIILTFSEVVTASEATGFIVTIGGSSTTLNLPVSGSGTNQLTISIVEEITKSSGTVEVSYDGGGDITDVTPNSLAAFTATTVTNNTTLNVVSDIAGLRALADGEDARVTGEMILAFRRTSRNQKWLSDASGSILIDDASGIISTTYNIGDGITNLEGTLATFSNARQFIPSSDAGAATNSNQTVNFTTVDISTLASTPNDYLEQTIEAIEVTFSEAGSTFASSTNYTLNQGGNTVTFRTQFESNLVAADAGLGFASATVPYGRLDVKGLGGAFSGTGQINGAYLSYIEDNYAPQFTAAPATANVGSSGFDVTFESDEPGTVYYVVNEVATTLSAADVLAGTSQAYTDVTGTPVTVNVGSLNPGTQYYVHILLEDDETSPNQMGDADVVTVTATTGNNDTDSELTDVSPQIAVDISSVANTEVEAVDIFTFAISDLGTSDGAPTIITKMVFEAGSNNTADWSTTIAGVVLEDDFTVNIPFTSELITSNSIEIDLTGNEFSIADTETEIIHLKVYLTTSVNDEDIVEVKIPASHGFLTDGAGSSLSSTISFGDLISEQQTVQVEATSFELDVPSITEPNADFIVTATAVDANGNTDIGARIVSLSKATGAGNLTSTGGLTGQNMTSGVKSWIDVRHDTEEEITVTVDDDGSAVTATSGAITITNNTPQDIAAQILITEIVITPTAGEFVEIYNNSGQIIALDNYYLTDATFAGGSQYYYNIVTGSNAGGGTFADWHAKFPAGASIAAGEVQTISLNGSDNFFATYGFNPTYELYEDGASADAIPDMEEAFASSINGQGGLTDSGEIVILYYWDGSTDLVTDIDMVMWGDAAEAVDKTGVTIDGPDGDATASAYLNDIATSSQQFLTPTPHASGSSWQRIDFNEGAETSTGGNGVDGNDETSEDITNTFEEATVDPGNVNLPGSPVITLDQTGFNGDFGYVASGSTSDISSYTVEGSDLTDGISVTPPVGFEVSTSSDFSSNVGDNSTPLVLAQTGGVVSTTTIYVRFAPDAADGSTDSGNITHSSTGAADKFVAVSGTEGEALTENFDSCLDLNSWSQYSVIGDQVWSCTDFGNNSTTGVQANGFSGSALDNEDWLLSPGLEITASSTLNFWYTTRYSGPDLLLKISSDYSGTGDPSSSTWSDLATLTSDNSNAWTENGDIDLSSFAGSNMYIAFVYYSNTTDGAARWTIDDIALPNTTTSTPLPELTVSVTSLTDFGTINNAANSASQNFTVSGLNLTSDITITAPSNFEVSTDDSSFSQEVVLDGSTGTVTTTTVYARFAPTSGINGPKSGNITVVTNGTSKSISVSGTEAGNSDITPISALRPIDSNGNPTTFGAEVTIQGTLIGLNSRSTGFQFAINDGTGGVVVRETTGSLTTDVLAEGDEIKVTGTVGFYNGTTQLDNLTSYELISTGNARVDATVVTALDETTEQELVRLEDVTITDNTQWVGASDYSGTGFNVDITFNGGASTGVLRIEDDGDLHLKTYADVFGTQTTGIVLVGIGGQFDSATPYTEGYQILVYQESDINPVVLEPGLTITTTGFTSDFGQVEVGAESAVSTYTLSASLLTEDLVVSVPAGFEVALDNAFSGIVGNSTTPMNVPSSIINDQTVTVFVKFAPSALGTVNGDIFHFSAGFVGQKIAVSGEGIEATTTTGLDELAKYNINVYPNPAAEVLNISIPQAFGEGEIRLLNLNGKEVLKGQIGSLNAINTTVLNNGIYILQISNANTVLNHRIVKK